MDHSCAVLISRSPVMEKDPSSILYARQTVSSLKKASSEKPAEFVLMVHQMPYGAIIEPKGRWSMVFSVSPSEHTKAKVYGQESVMGKMMALSRRLPLKMPEGKVLFKVAMTS
jgi:hypothetical protein